jgi:hypothetical protein
MVRPLQSMVDSLPDSGGGQPGPWTPTRAGGVGRGRFAVPVALSKCAWGLRLMGVGTYRQ